MRIFAANMPVMKRLGCSMLRAANAMRAFTHRLEIEMSFWTVDDYKLIYRDWNTADLLEEKSLLLEKENYLACQAISEIISELN